MSKKKQFCISDLIKIADDKVGSNDEDLYSLPLAWFIVDKKGKVWNAKGMEIFYCWKNAPPCVSFVLGNIEQFTDLPTLLADAERLY